MSAEGLRDNIKQIKRVIRELYIFTNQLEIINNLEVGNEANIDPKEKKLLTDAISALTNQLKILNNSIPNLITNISGYKQLPTSQSPNPVTKTGTPEIDKLIQVSYQPAAEEKVSVTITDKDKKEFLNNLSKSHLSISQLKKDYAMEKPQQGFGKPNVYAKTSSKFFRGLANKFIVRGYFNQLNKDLRKINSPFVIGSYVSMIFFSVFIVFIISLFVLITLLFYNISIIIPFLTPVEEPIMFRFIKFFWIILALPLSTGLLMYYYPSSEAKNIGGKINQELPFVAIHMSAVATSGVEPISIFRIILKSPEYKYTNMEIRKLMNLINFHGKDLVTALKKSARSSPSPKLKELFDGLATTITSGGSLNKFLDKHAESLLFDFRLEREKYTKTSETFMDIYISIVIAAPMILLMLFVIMGSTGVLGNFLGLTTGALSVIIIMSIVVLNIGFLMFLHLKQPNL